MAITSAKISVVKQQMTTTSVINIESKLIYHLSTNKTKLNYVDLPSVNKIK